MRAVHVLVGPGDTIHVKAGIYREAVTLGTSGTKDSPITLQAYSNDRVVISGASRITGWTQCTDAVAKGNPHYADIYYADVDYRITTLHQDNVRKWKSRMPEHGFWKIERATATTIMDAKNLTQGDDFWIGAEVFNRIAQTESLVTNFDSSTSTLTIKTRRGVPSAGHVYFMQNLVELINEPGEWAVSDLSGGDYRVFFWADGGGDPDNYLVESPDPEVNEFGFLVNLSRESYWVVDGFEIRHSMGAGVGSTKRATPLAGHNLIQNCLIHHNPVGVQEINTDGTTYRRNAILHSGVMSGTGVKLHPPCSNMVFEENEIAWNYKDGMKIHGDNLTLRRNYVHDHFMFGHPDNLQTTHPGLNGLLLDSNVLWNAGQNYMTENLDDEINMRNNVIGGAYSSSIPWGRTTTTGYDPHLILDSNTFAFSGDSPIVGASVHEYDWNDNIIMTGNANHLFLMKSAADFTSDYNLFFFADGIVEEDERLVIWNRSFRIYGFDRYQEVSGQEAHSLYANPMFTSAPAYLCATAFYDRIDEVTSARMYLSIRAGEFFAVGDNIEIDWDGVVRTVTAKVTDATHTYLEFTPGTPRIQYKCMAIANWKTASDYTLDLTPATGSPARGNGSGGGDIGSTINTIQFMQCDFDGDGVRDVPAYKEDPGLAGYGPW